MNQHNNSEFKKFCNDNKIACDFDNCDITNFKEFNFIIEPFLKKPFSLMLLGDPGIGKTHLMLALLKEYLDNRKYPRYMFRYFEASVLDDKIDADYKCYGNANYLIQSICEDHFLFIDDFGIEKSKEKAERNYFKIFNDRLVMKKPTVITTNLGEQEILNIYGARISSRLKLCHKLVMTGEDKRKPPQL